MVRISIIIPVYKVEAYVRRCIESILVQDSTKAIIECIIIDDCTPDRSMDVVHEITDYYRGPITFFFLRHKNNKGLSAARNTGLQHATGDYVLFVDSDDWLKPDCIHLFVEYLLKYPDVEIIVGNALECKRGDVMLENVSNPLYLEDNTLILQGLFRFHFYINAWNKIIKRDILKINNINFIEGIIYEDMPWCYNLFSHVSKALFLPVITYVYEDNPVSIINTSYTKDKVNNAVRSYAIGVDWILDNPYSRRKTNCNLTVDYLLFVLSYMMIGIDMIIQCPVSDEISKEFNVVRNRLLLKSIRNGRVLVSLFVLLLFPPFNRIIRYRLFRSHYHRMMVVINRLSHLTDCLHKK